MSSAAGIIEALLGRRRLKSIRPEVVGQLPPGWREWLAAMPRRTGAVTGARSQDIIAQLIRRPLRAPPKAGVGLNRWQAFATVWRQQWHPASEDERWLRVVAATGSVLIHLVLTVVLAWLMYLQYFAMLAPPPEEANVVRVQYIGEGTPEAPIPSPREDPVLPPASPSEAVADAPAQAASVPAASPVVNPPETVATVPEPDIVAPVPPTPELDIDLPTPQAPAPLPQQPLLVTEVAQPDIEFVLVPPIPSVPELASPSLAVPELTVPAREIEKVEIAPVPSLAKPTIDVPDPVVPQAAPVLPEVPARPVPQAVVAEPVPLEIPQVASQPLQTQPRPSPPDVRLPSPEPAIEPAPAPAAPTAAAPTVPRPVPQPVTEAGEPANAAPAAMASDNQPSAPATDAAAPAATPNPWPAPTRGDDWGEALRSQPGKQGGQPPGLFDETGRPRLAGTSDQPAQGAAPGSAEQQAIDLDRAGTWLKRPPYDYTPTRFDRFWIPGGTLLEEWVRRGIKQVSIPIPGTSKRIDCVVSILQLGGGCMLADDNLNNQPATARPPPDIPFKPELQENQESLRRDN